MTASDVVRNSYPQFSSKSMCGFESRGVLYSVYVK